MTYPPGFDGEQPSLQSTELLKGRERESRHARKMIASYEKWFEDEPDEVNSAALVILRFMGLFNRPPEPGCIRALREEPIAGLSEALFAGSDTEETWRKAILRLQRARLLERRGHHWNDIDSHPLIREYFAARLDEEYADSAREAHRHLYEHLKQSTPELPDNLNDMMPLYHAVAHGCKAGQIANALESIYRKRISRRADYGWKRLGAVGMDLAACASFFACYWNRLKTDVPSVRQGFLFGQTGLLLRAVGRAQESVDPMRAGYEIDIQNGDWANAATTLGNLCETNYLLGRFSEAINCGIDAVTTARKSHNIATCFATESKLARVFHFVGQLNASQTMFKKIEQKEIQINPQYKSIYSMPGYWFSDLSWTQARALMLESPTVNTKRLKKLADRIESRAREAMKWSQSNGGSDIDKGLDSLPQRCKKSKRRGLQRFATLVA